MREKYSLSFAVTMSCMIGINEERRKGKEGGGTIPARDIWTSNDLHRNFSRSKPCEDFLEEETQHRSRLPPSAVQFFFFSPLIFSGSMLRYNLILCSRSANKYLKISSKLARRIKFSVYYLLNRSPFIVESTK